MQLTEETVQLLRYILQLRLIQMLDTGGESMGRSMRAGLAELVLHSWPWPESEYFTPLKLAAEDNIRHFYELAKPVLEYAAKAARKDLPAEEQSSLEEDHRYAGQSLAKLWSWAQARA